MKHWRGVAAPAIVLLCMGRLGGSLRLHRVNGTERPTSALGVHRTVLARGRQATLEWRQSPTETCHPKCSWTCQTTSCDQVCEPICAPPVCETGCAPVNTATCKQVCEPPDCAVICPTHHCEHGNCPACKTVCGPARCETHCADNCESRCRAPHCDWKCQAAACPQPQCEMSCDEPACQTPDVDTQPALPSDMTVLSKKLAGLDPAQLNTKGFSPGCTVEPCNDSAPPLAGAPGPAPAAR